MIDVRSQIDPSLKVDDSINCISEHAVTSAYGSKSLSSIEIAKYDANTNSIGSSKKINVDALLVSGGYTPTINLCSQTGTPAVFDDTVQAFIPGKANRNWEGCGAVMGAFSLEEILTTNKIENNGKKAIPLAITEIPSANRSEKKFVDLQHDVTVKDIKVAHIEGFRSVEHLKRYTTLGTVSYTHLTLPTKA